MKAGREMDVMVATKVLGHQFLMSEHGQWYVMSLGERRELPKYSTDEAVAEKLLARLGYSLFSFSKTPDRGYQFSLDKKKMPGVIYGIDEDAPLAYLMCLAALRSVGETI